MKAESRDSLTNERYQYLATLTRVRDWYTEKGMNPLFVGGVIAKTLTPRSIEKSIFDHGSRTVRIPIDTQAFTSRRSDGTFDDFDLIVNHPDQTYVATTISECDAMLSREGLTSHFVSAEPVRYPDWRPKRNKVTQMVSGIDVLDDDSLRFTYGYTISPPPTSGVIGPMGVYIRGK